MLLLLAGDVELLIRETQEIKKITVNQIKILACNVQKIYDAWTFEGQKSVVVWTFLKHIERKS